MSFIRIISVFAIFALSACGLTVYSGSEGRQAAVANGMPTLESLGHNAAIAQAEGRVRQPKPIIAFGRVESLELCLRRLTAFSQLIAANDGSLIAGGNCSFGAPTVVHEDDDYFAVKLLETRTHIYPIIRIDLVSNSALLHSHDAMMSRNDWLISREVGANACTSRQIDTWGGCIVPRRCEALREYRSSGQIAKFWFDDGYIRQTARCTSLR